MPEKNRHPPAGLTRRIAAGMYDGLLLLALLVIPTLLVIALSGGESIPPGNHLFQSLLLATAAVFFIGFWTHGGQTLGMRAWRLRVERQTGAPLTTRIGALRFLAGLLSIAALGLGFWWLVIDPQKLTWHDRIAGTRVVVLPKT